MEIRFTKMHGIGNDYIYVNCLNKELDDFGAVSAAMSPRHFSVGADGLVAICRSEIADAKMRMFNLDGSEGKMCGNAIRCVGKYLYDNGLTDKTQLSIETLSGIKYLTLHTENGKVKTVSVDMGTAELRPEAIPVALEGERIVDRPHTVAGTEYRMTCVSMGNPHAVMFVEDPKTMDLESVGPKFEMDPIFPDRVNAEFAKVLDPRTIEMRVWERGSGETYACGTGACATVVAAVVNGLSPYDEPVTVRLIGGELHITVTKDLHVYMTGSATKVYEGVYDYEDQAQ